MSATAAKAPSDQKLILGLTPFKFTGFILGLIVGLLAWNMKIEGLEANGTHALAVVFMVSIWWIFTCMPAVYPALIACLIFMVAKIVPGTQPWAGFSNPTIWMYPFALILAAGVGKTGLAKRVATVLLTVGGPLSFKRVVITFIAMCTFAPFFIPSGTATITILFTLAVGLVQAVGLDHTKRSELSAALTTFLSILTLMMARLPLTGAAPSVVSVGLIRELTGVDITYMDWLQSMWITAPVLIVATYFYVMKMYKPEVDLGKPEVKAKLLSDLHAMGNMSLSEKKAALYTCLALFLWLTTGFLHSLSAQSVAGICAGLMLLPVTGFLTIKDFKALPWDVFVFAGATYTMGVVLTNTGFADYAGNIVSGMSIYTGSFTYVGMMLFLTVFLLHLLLPTQGLVTMTIPIFVKAGVLTPKAIGMLIPLGAGQYLFPFQGSPLLIAIGFGTCSWGDITKYGFFISGVALLQSIPLLEFYWSWTFL